MKYIITAAFFILVCALSAPATHACVCQVPNVSTAFDKASYVFVGVITEIEEPHTSSNPQSSSDLFFTIKFKVEKSWKGRLSPEIKVLADQGRLGCFSYQTVYIGEKYLVYTDPFSSEDSDRKDLVMIDACNRTGLVGEEAPTSLDYAFSDWLGRRYASRGLRDWMGRIYRTEDLQELEAITNQVSRPRFNLFSSPRR